MIHLVRHPLTQVPPGICYGRLDPDVADPASAITLAAALRDLGGKVWTSPARRCRVVADSLMTSRVDARLQELNFGEWEGVAWDNIPRDALDRWAADPLGFAAPGGETGESLIARVTAFAGELRNGDHVVITHGGPLKVLVKLLRNQPVDLFAAPPDMGSITRIG